MKLEFTEISMTEIDDFYQCILTDISKFEGEKYTLDFVSVESLSLPAIQILISLRKHCDDKNIQLECININSSNITESLEIYNLKDRLGIK